MALSTIMGTSYAPLGAVRTLENVGKRRGADLLLNFLELSQGEVRRVYLPRTRVNKVVRSPGLLLQVDLDEQHPRLEQPHEDRDEYARHMPVKTSQPTCQHSDACHHQW